MNNNIGYKDVQLHSFCQKFAYFYESEYGLEARKKITDLGITKITINENHVEICLERPGLLIGKQCQNINKLSDFFSGWTIKITESENPTNNILNRLNDRCLICGKEIKEEYKCEDLNSDANFCSDKCRDEYIKEQSNWE